MKKDNINYFMVGLFVIAGLVLLFVMLFKITGNQSNADEYFVEFSNVSGIKDGVQVTYSGYQIGAVNEVVPIIEQAQTRYRISLWIKSGWRIPLDSSAQIVMPALISDKQIEITQGISAEKLKPGDTIQSAEAVDIMQLVDSIANKLNDFVPQTTANINQLLEQLNFSARQMAVILSTDNVQHLNNLFKQADVSGKNLADLTANFASVNTQLDNILKKTDLLLDDNSGDIRYTVIELKKSMSSISSRIESVMYNLDSTSQNMNEFTRTLRNNPSVLLGSEAPADKHTDN